MQKQMLLSGLLLTVLALVVLAEGHAGADTPNVNAMSSLDLFNANNANPSPDFDGDGVVGIPDFLEFVNHFGAMRGDEKYDAKYDLDGNGAIGIPDFLIFVDSFGSQVPPSGGGGSGGGSSSPDLIVESPSVSNSTLMTGESFTLSATVRNQGNDQSATTTLRYYLSTDETITTGDTEVETDYVTRLDPSASSDESARIKAPSSEGTYYYGACVDAVSGESDTGNNCSSAVTVTVLGSDLIVESPSVSDNTLTPGQSFTLNATVRNQGTGSSTSTTLRYYLSTDETITTSDTEVGTDSVSGLSASGTSAESVSLNAPSSAGTYYYGACVESVSGESDTNNNCSDGVSVTVSSSSSGDSVDDDLEPPRSALRGLRIKNNGKFTHTSLTLFGIPIWVGCAKGVTWYYGGIPYILVSSRWQKKEGTSWVDIPGTRLVDEVCGYETDVPGTYRLIVVMDVQGKIIQFFSENTFTV